MLVIETEGTGSGNSWDMRRASLKNKSRLDSASFPNFLYWSLQYEVSKDLNCMSNVHDALSSSCLLLARVTGALSCLCGHWPDQSPVSLCPQTLGACAPRPCARAPSPLNTPQFILTSIKTFQSPLCRRCRHPMTPDSSLAPSLRLFVSHAPDVAMGTDSRAEH